EVLLKLAKDCDFIAHTAAQPAMTIALENPELDFSTNVVGTYNVLETARKYDIPVVSCSTIHVYGNKLNAELKETEKRFVREPPTISENAPTLLGEVTPLHASKRCTEIYIDCFIDTYGLKAANFRLTGMYGPRQIGSEDHGWVANFAIKTVMEMPIKVYGPDKQVRDILYASDAAEAFEAFYKYQKPGTYNVGGGVKNVISLREALEMLSKITGKTQNIFYEAPRKGDLWYFVCDISKIKSALNWEPRVSNEEGLIKLVRWIEANKELFRRF
ncbi:MAG: GDP-mannose 4,6-dehydratase, partial [Thermoplasmata archaeon]